MNADGTPAISPVAASPARNVPTPPNGDSDALSASEAREALVHQIAADARVTLFDPAKNAVVTMTLEDMARALWAAQAMLHDEEDTRNPDWPDESCWTSFEDLVGWTHDTEMFYEHSEAALTAGVRVEDDAAGRLGCTLIDHDEIAGLRLVLDAATQLRKRRAAMTNPNVRLDNDRLREASESMWFAERAFWVAVNAAGAARRASEETPDGR